jgi:tetratricopeptide (TPR) repeat protein
VYVEEGKFDQAEPLLTLSLDSMQRSLGPIHPDVAQVYATLAKLYLKRGAYDQSESYCQDALDILGKTSQRNYPALIAVLSTYVTVLLHTNRRAQAELFQTKAMTYKAEFTEINNAR